MSCVYVTSDWHLDHSNCAKWRGFDDVHHHNQTIMQNYRNVITERDVVWFLGDILLGEHSIAEFRELPGRKRLVLGNHDTDRFQKRTGLETADLLEIFEEIHGMVKYKKAWLTHAPLHPLELRGRLNIHGHMHNHTVPDERYVNVALEQTDFKPVKYQEILRRLDGE